MAESDILFQNEDVCILRPESPRGILVFTISTSKNICTEGILSYNELRKRHPELGLINRNKHHHDPSHNDLIFFRAPYNSDVSTFESSYDGKSPKDMIKGSKSAIAVIRIDPHKTFVYSSETRSHGSYSELLNSRIPLLDYLTRIKEHSKFIAHYPNKVCANIVSYEKKAVHHSYNCNHPWEEYTPIERMAEIVVKLPNIHPEWLVSCDYTNIGGGKRKKRTQRKIKRSRKTRK